MVEILLSYDIDNKHYELTGFKSLWSGRYLMELSDGEGSEINFYQEDTEKLLDVLERIELAGLTGVDFATSEEYNEDTEEYTGEYYWDDSTMDNDDINPYFGADNGMYGTWCSIDTIRIFIGMLYEYIGERPIDINDIEMYGLKTLMKLYKEVVNG